ncbi:MAG: CCA tRNA nucleotidyltransferase [Merismopedia sp. SIO2A8]|nr:CCA tRNA nucleotidyltransferase [Merismopedia sp. SIO2A8]
MPLSGPIFDPQYWPFGLEYLPASAHLVGGSVRDALLGREADHLDLDFVLADGAVETAQAIAKHYHAGFVVLDEKRHIARVVFEGATADFAQQVGSSLEEDLCRRDFTVNAIAYNPRTRQLVDPLHGHADLKQRCLRMIEVANLKDDPLRLLRAYRQAAQLGFEIDTETQTQIRQLAPSLKRIASERVNAELSYLLACRRGHPLLKQAWADGLLREWLPDINFTGLEWAQGIDQAVSTLTGYCPAFKEVASGWVGEHHPSMGTGRSWIKVAKLACLVPSELEDAESQLWHLKCSRSEVQAVLTVLRWMNDGVLPTQSRAQFFFFRDVGVAFPAVALMAIALGHPLEAIAPLIDYSLERTNPIAHPQPILTGHDLTKTLQLKPGPIIGQLLEQLCIAHAEGQISNRDEALAYMQRLMESAE